MPLLLLYHFSLSFLYLFAKTASSLLPLILAWDSKVERRREQRSAWFECCFLWSTLNFGCESEIGIEFCYSIWSDEQVMNIFFRNIVNIKWYIIFYFFPLSFAETKIWKSKNLLSMCGSVQWSFLRRNYSWRMPRRWLAKFIPAICRRMFWWS